VRSARHVRRISSTLVMLRQAISASAARGRRARKNNGVQAALSARSRSRPPASWPRSRLWARVSAHGACVGDGHIQRRPDQRVGRRRGLPPGLAQTAVPGGPRGRPRGRRSPRWPLRRRQRRLSSSWPWRAPVVSGETGPRDHDAAMMTLTRVPHAPMPGGPELAAGRRGRGGRRVWNCLGHSRFRALRRPASASLPRRSNAGLSSGAAMRDRPLKVNSAA
jgi:hypothetical protein